MENPENENVMVYPNPNAGNFSFQCSSAMEVCLYNELGQLLMQRQTTESEGYKIEFEAVSAGLYFLTWKTENGIQTRKVIVNP
jgi:hypothetical protein